MRMNFASKLKVVVATISLWALFVLPAFADTTSIKVGVNKNMFAQLMTPDGPGPYPALLLLHTSGGIQSGDYDYAKRLVAEGYVVLVPSFLDAYGITAKTRQLTFTTYAEPIYADFVAILEVLRSNNKVNGKKLGAIGFSNGGYFALWLAATGQVQVGVSYYGALSGAGSDSSLNRFQQVFSATSSPVLVLHGANDSTVPVRKAIELTNILTEKQASYQFHQYDGAGHRFDRDGGASNEAAADDAWQRTIASLSKVLKE
jgi:carboxymethylenebutenolidase